MYVYIYIYTYIYIDIHIIYSSIHTVLLHTVLLSSSLRSISNTPKNCQKPSPCGLAKVKRFKVPTHKVDVSFHDLEHRRRFGHAIQPALGSKDGGAVAQPT